MRALKERKRITKKNRSVLVGDTSALISLEVGTLLEDSFQLFDYFIPGRVLNEIKEISSYEDETAIAAKNILKLMEEGKITEVSVKDHEKVKEVMNSKKTIDMGEAESLILAQETDVKILITDDLRSLKALKELSGEIRIHLSVYVIARMVLSEIIDKSVANECLSKISDKRSWENAAIYNKAMEYIKDL